MSNVECTVGFGVSNLCGECKFQDFGLELFVENLGCRIWGA